MHMEPPGIQVVSIAGFLDSADDEGLVVLRARFSEAGFGVMRYEWPGIWSRSREGQDAYRFSAALQEVATLAASAPTVLIGHSLGARVALHVAARVASVRAVIALCPSVASAPFAEEAEAWQRDGRIRSSRVDPVDRTARSFTVPVAFLEDVLAAGVPPIPDVPTLCVVGERDTRTTMEMVSQWRRGNDRVSIVSAACAHRFWEDGLATEIADISVGFVLALES
jgi:pimeloyl-ACP methyl ester carboxylesterase